MHPDVMFPAEVDTFAEREMAWCGSLKASAKSLRPCRTKILRVPRVHRFFSDDIRRGYLMIDYMEGIVIDLLEDQELINRLDEVLDHLSTLIKKNRDEGLKVLRAEKRRTKSATWSNRENWI